MVEQHQETGAGVTVAAIRQPISLADQFGVIEVDDADQRKIGQFLEKPKNAKGLPDAPDEVLASMGNYVFDADVLVDAVTSDHDLEGTKHDMGGDIVPAFVNKGEGYVYDFKNNDVPGSTERDRTYWRDVGTIDSFYDAHMDLISPLFRSSTSTTPSGRSTPARRHLPAGQVCPRPAVTASARPSTRRSRRAASSPAPRSTGRCSRRGSRCTATRPSSTA